MMTSLSPGQVGNAYDFFSTSVKHVTTKLHRKRAVCSGLTLNVMMTSFQLGYLAGVYDFVSPAIISIATKSGRMTNQHAMNLTLQVMIT